MEKEEIYKSNILENAKKKIIQTHLLENIYLINFDFPRFFEDDEEKSNLFVEEFLLFGLRDDFDSFL